MIILETENQSKQQMLAVDGYKTIFAHSLLLWSGNQVFGVIRLS